MCQSIVGDSDGDSSGDDSVLIERGFRDVVDEEVPPTVWDEVIVNRTLDRVDLISIFKLRASVMKSQPKFLRGIPFCNPCRFDGGGPWHRNW